MMTKDEMSFRQKMNSALDHELSEEELAELQSRLEGTPEDSEEWEQLRKTDELLRTTPMVGPSAVFRKRVMDAIAAMPLPEFVKRDLNMGLALGLLAAAILAIPAMALVLFLVLSLITNPATFSTLLQASIDVMSYGVGLAVDIADEVRDWVAETPALAVLLVLTIPLSAIWGWILWRLVNGRSLSIRRTRS